MMCRKLKQAYNLENAQARVREQLTEEVTSKLKPNTAKEPPEYLKGKHSRWRKQV
jgi:hypothetical protein